MNVSIVLSLILIINITSDLRFIENANLRKLLTKGPNYREPKALAEIATGLDNCIENLASKTKHNVNNFKQW